MADSEPEVEVGFNEERCMFGMAGDDDDDNLQDDVAAFDFGDNVAINAEDDEEEPPPPPPVAAAAALPRTATRKTKAKVKSLPLLSGRTLCRGYPWGSPNNQEKTHFSQNNKNTNEFTNCKLHPTQSRPGDRSPRPRQPQRPTERSVPAPLG
jgi:hypothetical protein